MKKIKVLPLSLAFLLLTGCSSRIISVEQTKAQALEMKNKLEDENLAVPDVIATTIESSNIDFDGKESYYRKELLVDKKEHYASYANFTADIDGENKVTTSEKFYILIDDKNLVFAYDVDDKKEYIYLYEGSSSEDEKLVETFNSSLTILSEVLCDVKEVSKLLYDEIDDMFDLQDDVDQFKAEYPGSKFEEEITIDCYTNGESHLSAKEAYNVASSFNEDGVEISINQYYERSIVFFDFLASSFYSELSLKIEEKISEEETITKEAIQTMSASWLYGVEYLDIDLSDFTKATDN